MKITQEAREFAAKQSSELGIQRLDDADAEKGMAEMSEKYRDGGSELYVEAD